MEARVRRQSLRGVVRNGFLGRTQYLHVDGIALILSGTYTSAMGRSTAGVYLASAGNTSKTFTVTHTSSGIYLDAILNAIYGDVYETPVTLTGSAGFEYIGLDNVSVEGVGRSHYSGADDLFSDGDRASRPRWRPSPK